MKIGQIVTGILIISLSCSDKNSSQSPSSFVRNDKVLITINNETGDGIRISVFRSLEDSLQEEYYSFNPVDTLLIPVNGYSVFKVSNKNVYSDSLYLNSGDSISIFISKDKDQPIVSGYDAKVENQSYDKTDSLYSLFYTDKPENDLMKEFMESMSGVDVTTDYERIDFSFNLIKNKEFFNSNPEIYQLVIDQLINKLNSQKLNISEVAAISPKSLEQLKADTEFFRAFKKLTSLYSFSKDKAVLDRIFNSNALSEKNLTQSPYGSNYVSFFVKEVVLGGERDRSGAMEYINYKKAYDQAPLYLADSLLIKLSREISLKHMLEFKESYEDISFYLNSYMSVYHDSSFLEDFKQKFLLDYEKDVKSKVGINLLDKKGNVFNLQDFLVRNKGKFIYVDYWASWCVPCIEAMKHSSQLRSEFTGEDLIFLYLSVDSNQSAWKNAVNKFGLEDHKESFMVLNYAHSDYIKQMKFQSIPRYMIYDKIGNLIEIDAPKPNGNNIRVKLTEFLKSNY